MKPIESWNGDAFRDLRRRSGTAAAELADSLGVTEKVLRRWEDGAEVPSGHARERLDAWLSQNPLVADEGAPPLGLAARSCAPVSRDSGPLVGAGFEELLASLDDAWSVEESVRLVREFTFPDFARALAFVDRVGAIAEAENHHPDLLLRWGRVTVKLWTHSVGGLTENDFILAAKVDEVRGD